MAYTKTTWACGDTITNTKLNNMENGISANDTAVTANTETIAEHTTAIENLQEAVDGISEPLIVNVNRFDNPITADKTFAEILEAYNGCRPIYINLRPVIGFMATEDSEESIYSLDLTTLDANAFDPTLFFDTYSVYDDNTWSYTSRGVDVQ